MTQLTCIACDWSGDETEVIQAGLNYELCPECETLLYDDPPVCGVSDRLQRRIRLQFAGVLLTAAVVVGVVVKWLRARATK